ncbi:MAG TPA: lipase [Ruminococcus sp.]|nr:lipase [Ruminococcus sp.]
MNSFKRSLYTILLVLTCFVASPWIFRQIWKTSAEAKKGTTAPPPAAGTLITPDATEPAGQDDAEPGAAEGAPQTAPAEQSTEPSTDTSAAAAPAEFTGFINVDPSYFDDALFVGDSRTVGIQEYGTLKNADYFCSVGLSATGITKNNEDIDGEHYEDKLDSKQYGKIYIMLGINEVGNDLESVMTFYRAMVEKAKAHQPDAVIYVMANLHVAHSAETNVINNAAINNLNSMMAQLADNKKVYYIDVNPLFDDGTGYLTEAYSFDGIHVLAEYYVNWCDWLCTKGVPFYRTTE